jgi:hypothetical protein
MIGAYRSIDAIVDDRLARFRARRAREQEAGDAVAGVFAARRGRVVGGVAGVVFGTLVFLSSVVASSGIEVVELPRECHVVPTYLLAGSGVTALAMAAMVRRAARRHARAALRREPVLTGDGAEDIGRLERADPLGDLHVRTTALEMTSIAFPLAAVALLAPLTIHGVVALGINVFNRGDLDFGVWIGLSAIFVGLAHLTLVVRMVRWARSLRGRETGGLRKGLHAQWALTLLLTAAAGFVPAVFFAKDSEILSLIPPGLVLVTGATFLPFAYVATARRLERERATLAVRASEQDRPCAVGPLLDEHS